MEKKAPTSRQCSSMPSSRHPSTEDLRFTGTVNSKSTPHTPIQSQSSSLIDISQHASLNQDNFDTFNKSLVFSDSTVTLNSLEIKDGSELRIRHVSKSNKENEKVNSDSNSNEPTPIKRIQSLQDVIYYNKL